MAPTLETYDASQKQSPGVRLLIFFLDSLRHWDSDSLDLIFDDSFEHQTLPKELGRPVLNKGQYLEYFHIIRPLFGKENNSRIHEVIECPGQKRISAHFSFFGESSTGLAYNHERMVFMHFTPSEAPDALPKITLIKEFIDSGDSVSFFQQEKARIAERKKNHDLVP